MNPERPSRPSTKIAGITNTEPPTTIPAVAPSVATCRFSSIVEVRRPAAPSMAE